MERYGKWIRLPMNQEFLNLETNDLLYGFLFLYSSWDTKTQTYFFLQDEWESMKYLFHQQIHDSLDSIQEDFNYLCEHGFIQEDKENYVLTNIYQAAPIESGIIELLVQTCQPHIIHIYSILLSGDSYFHKFHKRPYSFSAAGIRRRLNCFSNHSKRLDRAIHFACYTLAKLGLYTCKPERISYNGSPSFPVNTITYITDSSEGIIADVREEDISHLYKEN